MPNNSNNKIFKNAATQSSRLAQSARCSMFEFSIAATDMMASVVEREQIWKCEDFKKCSLQKKMQLK